MTDVLNGQGVEAEEHYQRRAEAGDTDAMYNLGVLLEGRDRRFQATKWYRRAADAGDVDAMFNLAGALESLGKPGEARDWYRRAAEAGDVDARTNLALLDDQVEAQSGDETPAGPVVEPSVPTTAPATQVQAQAPPPPRSAEGSAPKAWQVPDTPQGASQQATRHQTTPPPASAWGVRQSRRRRRWPIVLAIGAGLVVAIVTVAVVVSAGTGVYNAEKSLTTNPPLTSNQPGPAASASGISLGDFNQITSGMSYLQVAEIFHSPGRLLSDSNIAGYHDQIYTWNGTTPGANANVTFQNGTVFAKAQFGLTS